MNAEPSEHCAPQSPDELDSDTCGATARRWFAVVALLLVMSVGMSDFYTRGEAREALVVQSIVTGGDWILPEGYGGAVPSKPPLFHWLGAALASAFPGGASEFAIRLPSTLAGVLGAAFFVLALRRSLDSHVLTLFFALLTLSFEWFRASVSARVDMVHAASLSAGMLCVYFAVIGAGFRWWVGSALLLCLAVLGKGPVAIALPALTGCTFIVSREGFTRAAVFPLLRLGAALVIAGLLALTWYVAAYLRAPDEFWARFWYENVARFTGAMGENPPHEHSVLYLLGMLFAGTLPWSPVVVAAIVSLRPRLRVSDCIESWRALGQLHRFSVIAAGTVLLFYSIPVSKRSVYLLAGYPFLALLSATFLHRPATNRFFERFAARLLIITAALALIAQLVVIPQFVAPKQSERALAQILAADGGCATKTFSYGYEFYGAAFYSGCRLSRLEDAVERGRQLSTGDRVITVSGKLPALMDMLKERSLDTSMVATTNLRSKTVHILRIGEHSVSSVAVGRPSENG